MGVAIGVGDWRRRLPKLYAQQDRVAQYVRLMGRGSGHLDFEAGWHVHMGKNAKPAEWLEKIQAFQH